MKKALVLIVLLLLANSFTLLAQNNKTDTSASKKDVDKTAVPNTSTDKKANEKALKQATQKRQADSIANIKVLKQALQKKQTDSLAMSKALKQSVQKKQADSIAAAKVSKLMAEKNKKDSLTTIKAKVAAITPEKNKKDTVAAQKVSTPVVATQIADTSHTAKTTGTPQLVPPKVKADTVQAKNNLNKKDLKKQNSKKSTPDSLSVKSKVKAPKGKSAKELKREAKKNDINNLSEKDIAKVAFKEMGSDSSIRNQANKRADISFTNARAVPLTEFGSNNIKFYHRYWRDIDLQDPKNARFATLHPDLITALLAAIKNKELKAYNPAAISPENPAGDAFTVTIPYLELVSGLSDTSVVNILDKDGNVTGTKTVPNPFTPEKIAGYRIKEDVFFDKTRARMITRIIGIAPLIKLTLSTGEVLSIQPLCWLRFKDCRKIFVTIDVDPTKKIGDSMDDVFLQRRFYGKIVQESNPEGKRIKDYKLDVAEQEIEAKRIEEKVAVFKKGTWNYTMLTEKPVQLPVNDKQPKPKKVKATTTKP